MDNEKLKDEYSDSTDELSKFLESIQSKVASLEEFSQPDPQSVAHILKERKKQRWIVFCFAIGSAVFSLLFLFSIIGIQAYFRIKNGSDFSILSGYELEVLSVSIFGQIIGIIYIIAKSIWDDSNFKEFYKSK